MSGSEQVAAYQEVRGRITDLIVQYPERRNEAGLPFPFRWAESALVD